MARHPRELAPDADYDLYIWEELGNSLNYILTVKSPLVKEGKGLKHDSVYRVAREELLTDPGKVYRECLRVIFDSVGEDKLREKPFLIQYAEPLSPLTHSPGSLKKLFLCADKGIPICYTPGILTGGTAPVTVAGALVTGNAEALSGIVLHQLRAKGAPIISGPGLCRSDDALARPFAGRFVYAFSFRHCTWNEFTGRNTSDRRHLLGRDCGAIEYSPDLLDDRHGPFTALFRLASCPSPELPNREVQVAWRLA